MRKESFMVIGSLLVALSFIAVLQPPISITGSVVHDGSEEKQCSIVKVPYEEYEIVSFQESFQETVSEDRALRFEAEKIVYTQIEGPDKENRTHAFINLTNIDVVEGLFTVSVQFIDPDKEHPPISKSRVLKPGEDLLLNKYYYDSRYPDVNVSFGTSSEVKTFTSTQTVNQPHEEIVAVQKFREETVCN